MPQKTNLLLILILGNFIGCKMQYKKNQTITIKENQEVVAFAENQNYQFDMIWRVKDYHYFENLKTQGIPSFLFVNVYDMSGELLKVEHGSRCELNTMEFFTDSIQYLPLLKTSCKSCHLDTVKQWTETIFTSQTLPRNPTHILLIGWASYYKNQKFIQQRTEQINAMLKLCKLKNPNILIVGLSMDPQIKEGNE